MRLKAPPKVLSKEWADISDDWNLWNVQAREACHTCGLWPRTTPTLPACQKDWTGKVVVLGPDPTWLEGSNGVIFMKAVRESGINPKDLYLMYALRCELKNQPVSLTHIRACRPGVLHLLHTLNPAVLVVCGSTALRCVMNSGSVESLISLRGRLQHPFVSDQMDMIGSPLSTVKTIVTYEPRLVNSMVQGKHQGHVYQWLVRDLKRINEPIVAPPQEVAEIRPGYIDDGPCYAVDMEYTPTHLLEVAFASPTQTSHHLYPQDEMTIEATLKSARWLIAHNFAGALQISSMLNQLVTFGSGKVMGNQPSG